MTSPAHTEVEIQDKELGLLPNVSAVSVLAVARTVYLFLLTVVKDGLEGADIDHLHPPKTHNDAAAVD